MAGGGAMPTFIALLRGINVGKARRVPMAGLRALLGDLGYRDVVTLLASGNAVFRARAGTAAKHADAIAGAIASRFGFDVPVIVKSDAELDAIVAGNALADHLRDPSRLLVAFVQDATALQALRAVEPLVAAPERFLLGRHAAYLYCPDGILASKAAVAWLGKAGNAATTRNWTTVLKVQAVAGQSNPGKGRP